MPNPRHRHQKPPTKSLISPFGDKVVKSIIHNGRKYWLHPTKGWRSGRVRT